MSDKQHTPGPWVLAERANTPTDSQGFKVLHETAGREIEIADTYHESDENQADADLWRDNQLRNYRGMSIGSGADEVISHLSDNDITYAKDPARGHYAGFAALHDLMDANMILPFATDTDCVANDTAYLVFCNRVMAEVTRRIMVVE